MTEKSSPTLIARGQFSLQRKDFSLSTAFEVESRGITGIYGASGAGKTTLLRCVAGLEPRVRGQLFVDDVCWQDSALGVFMPPELREIGYVFQDGRLFSHLSVERNLFYGYRRRGGRASRIDPDQIMDLLGLKPLLGRMPRALSGGEQQRVAIGRALLCAPRLVLMDEPLANLDQARKEEILPFLDRIHGALSLPMLYVSHSLYEITRLCDQLVLMEQGAVLAAGDLNQVLTRPDLPLIDSDEAVAVVNAQVLQHDLLYQLTELELLNGGTLWVSAKAGMIGETVRLRILARDVSLSLDLPSESTILNVLPTRIEALSALPGSPFCSAVLRVGEQRIMARMTRKSRDRLSLTEGMRVFAQVKGVAIQPSLAVQPS